MKCNLNLLLIYSFIFLSFGCVPKLQQTVDDATTSAADKNLNRKIASDNATATFNALDVQMNIRIGDREFIQNVFVDVFGPTVDTIVRPFIINNGMVLNGGCSQYEATYPDIGAATGNLVIDDVKADCNVSVFNLPVIGNENSIREGLRIQACEKAVSDANSLFYLIDNVTGVTNVQASFATSPTDSHITKIYNRFYPGRTISTEVLTSLHALSAAASLTTAKDRFKMVTFTVCMSADWQIP